MNSLYLGIAICAALAGCATTQWHGNLMTNEQLIAADCDQLAIEERKTAENSQYLSESATGSAIAAMFVAAFEGGAKTGGTSASSVAASSDRLASQSAEMGNRRTLIAKLRAKKGCS